MHNHKEQRRMGTSQACLTALLHTAQLNKSWAHFSAEFPVLLCPSPPAGVLPPNTAHVACLHSSKYNQGGYESNSSFERSQDCLCAQSQPSRSQWSRYATAWHISSGWFRRLANGPLINTPPWCTNCSWGVFRAPPLCTEGACHVQCTVCAKDAEMANFLARQKKFECQMEYLSVAKMLTGKKP